MARGDLPALVRLEIGDEPALWRRLGFAVMEDGVTQIGGVVVALTGAGPSAGITGWGLSGPAVLPAQVDGIATSAAAAPAGAPPEHPNGALRVDHVVVATPDVQRTLGALAGLGLRVSRVRETGLPGPRARQAFVWSGDVILEVVGPQAPEGGAPAALWGLTVVTADIDALPARTDGAVGSIRDAVQQGRRIAPVRADAGSTVPLAFMTPHVGRGPEDQEQSTA